MSLAVNVHSWYQQRVTDRSYLGQFFRRMRRFYLGIFKPEYIQKSIAENRTGELIYRCPFLGRDGQNLPYCRVYGELRPTNCRSYPFDKTDSEIDQCGYKFK